MKGPVVNVEAAGMLGLGRWVGFPTLYRLLEEGPAQIGDSLPVHARRVERLPDPCLDAYPDGRVWACEPSGQRLVGVTVNSYAD